MRFVRQFVLLLAIVSLAIVPIVGVGCNDEPKATPPAKGEPSVDANKKADSKAGKAKKGRATDESGSTTGSLGVKPPAAPKDAKK